MGQKANMYLDYEIMHDEVTGSGIYCSLHLPNKVVNFLVDFGLFQEKDYIYRNNILSFEPDKLSYVFLTHIHTDHCGRLPMLYKNGYKHKIHTTEISKKLLPVSLNNTCEILNHSKKEFCPIYDKNDVEKTYKNTCGYKYNKLIKLDENISFMLLGNGHLFGAACIYMNFSYPGEKDIDVIFTGDYSNKNIFFEIPKIPKFILNTPVTIVQEATYGSTKTDEIQYTLLDNIKQAISQNKSILFPAFSIGRYQESEYLVKCLQNNHIIPRRYKVYLDGVMPHEYNEKLKKITNFFKPNTKDFTPYKSYKVVSEINENAKNNKNAQNKNSNKKNNTLKPAIRDKVINSTAPKIVISSSGMGSYGPSHEYIRNWISREDVLIQFLGYVAEGTLGRILQNISLNENYIAPTDQVITKKADVKFTNETSSHAKQNELIAFLNMFQKINCLFINHGNIYQKNEYAKVSKELTNAKDIIVMKSKEVYRIGAYGFIKSFSKYN